MPDFIGEGLTWIAVIITAAILAVAIDYFLYGKGRHKW